MILVTGPVGSGKTTTLYSALNEIDIFTKSIITIEDPVEYQLPGLTQVEVDSKIGLTFAALPIGLVISVILMAAFYFIVLTPVGLVFKLIGRDLLRRRLDPHSSTYWVRRERGDDLERYFHQS